MQLARDATSSGDPVTAENYHQHAEHYLRLIAAAQEQFRQQNPYYRPEGEMRDDNSGDDAFDESNDGTQPPIPGGQPNFGNSQQPYPPREPQPFSGQPQQPHQQHRPQHQQHHQPQHQQHNQPHQQHQQPQHNQPSHQPGGNEGNESSDGERLPSFITGGQPQQNLDQNGYDNQGGDRYGMHRRRRRHRGHQRGDAQGGQGTGGGDAPDNRRPDND